MSRRCHFEFLICAPRCSCGLTASVESSESCERMQSSPRPRRIEVPQAVPFRNCASMNPRCGSHAEIVAGERASIGVGRQGVGICPAEPADTPGDLRPQQRNASGIRGSSCNRYPWRARSPVARSGGQQGPNGRLQMRLQDIHSVTPSVLRRQKVPSCPQVTPAEGGAAYTLTARWLGWGKLSVDRWGSLGVVRGVSRLPW